MKYSNYLRVAIEAFNPFWLAECPVINAIVNGQNYLSVKHITVEDIGHFQSESIRESLLSVSGDETHFIQGTN